MHLISKRFLSISASAVFMGSFAVDSPDRAKAVVGAGQDGDVTVVMFRGLEDTTKLFSAPRHLKVPISRNLSVTAMSCAFTAPTTHTSSESATSHRSFALAPNPAAVDS